MKTSASKVSSSETVPELEIRSRVGEEASLRQQGQATAAQAQKEEALKSVRPLGDSIADIGNVKRPPYKKKLRLLPHISPSQAIRGASVFVGGISKPPRQTQVRKYGGGEPDGVMPEFIAAEIAKFERLHYANREKHGGSAFGEGWKNRVQFIGAMTYLAQESGIPERRLFGYKRMEFKFVKFTHAEQILRAIGVEHKLATGEIPVVKNPRWSWRQFGVYMRARGVV